MFRNEELTLPQRPPPPHPTDGPDRNPRALTSGPPFGKFLQAIHVTSSAPPAVMTLSRREFVAQSSSCAAHLALGAAFASPLTRALWGHNHIGQVVAREPFGSLEKVADGIWALVSTPLSGDRTTTCNGGIVAGRNAVLAIEGFNTPAGAAWMAGKARELTGKWPTHVALTHYHADHTTGVAAYLTAADHPAVRATLSTRAQVLEKNPADPDRAAALKDVTMIDGSAPSTLELGGRTVKLVPRAGHTTSDVTIELDSPDLIFGGDLVWNAMVPNYVDAMPTLLRKTVAAVRRSGDTTIYVPGHGALARAADFDRYVAMLDEIEKGARAAHAAGKTPAEAGAAYALPASLADFALFNKVFFERAFAAWYKEI